MPVASGLDLPSWESDMRQIFFISPNGYPAVHKAFTPRIHGASSSHWCPHDKDASRDQVIGVVEMTGTCDPERVIDVLEREGIMWLPNHHTGGQIAPEHAAALAEHRVQPGDTTLQAMTKVYANAGFPPLKPKRF